MYCVPGIDVFHYADDNTIGVMAESVESVLSNLSAACNSMLSWYADNFMQANPDKFQLIIFNNQNTPGCITVNNKVLISEPVVKLLGVLIDKKLCFNEHIDSMCQKASRSTNVFSKLSRHFTIENKLVLFRSFILSHFSYCQLIWHFCSQADTKKIDKVQFRALRFI